MFIQCKLGIHTVIRNINPGSQVNHLLNELNLDQESCYVLQNGRRIADGCSLQDGNIYHIIPRVLGGKGGFGSMLRAIGAQIEKTTSREACRDLSGRRMRDVNNEKKLKEWLAKESDREREKEERKQERLAAAMAGPKHKFDDPEYHKQRSKVQEDLDDALQKGLKRSVGKDGDGASSSQSKPAKKVKTSSNKEWLGMDLDSDDLESDSDNEANPGSPSLRQAEIDHSSSSSSKEEGESANPLEVETSITHRDNVLCHSSGSDGEAAKALADDVAKSSADSRNKEDDSTDDDKPVDLDAVESVDDLEAMSLNRLKNALMIRGLKCGGTLEERVERLFSVKGLSPDQIPTSLMAKSKGVGKKSK